MKMCPPHQYIDRSSTQVVTEQLLGDKSVQFLYNTLRENAPTMFRALTSKRMSGLLSFCHYDHLGIRNQQGKPLFEKIGADWRECVEDLSFFDSNKKVFERQIKYWKTRPLEDDKNAIASPADCRILIGSVASTSKFFIKEKFFSLNELLGTTSQWNAVFANGDFAVCRLTPDKYHYNHVPVSGKVIDIYSIDGDYHSCNPAATIAIASIYSKNRRVVTIIDTNVLGGSQVGHIAMVEIVALMIGDLSQAYSSREYHNPIPVTKGMFLTKGQPKSLYKPGSSTDVLIFEHGTIDFCEDLQQNAKRRDASSRFTDRNGIPIIETDVKVRSTIAYKNNRYAAQDFVKRVQH